jgi:hypothetical protein
MEKTKRRKKEQIKNKRLIERKRDSGRIAAMRSAGSVSWKRAPFNASAKSRKYISLTYVLHQG